MSLLQKVTKGRKHRPRRTLLYGVHGIGKSTWGSQWPEAVVVPTEDGIGDLDVASFPLCRSASDCYRAAIELSGGEDAHPFKTVVLDSADWLEQLIWRQVCEKEGKKSISDFGYGSGYSKAASIFRDILGALDACRNAGLHVLVLAHSEIKRFENPAGDSFDRYQPKLHRDVSGLIQEWADEVLFANYKTHVKKTSEGFNRERGVGIGGDRVIYTSEQPSHLAKNRLGLPEQMGFNFDEYQEYLVSSHQKPAS